MKKLLDLPIKWKVLIILLLIVYAGMWFAIGAVSNRQKAEKIKSSGSAVKSSVMPEVAGIANPINGIFYTKKEAEVWGNRVPLAIMVENSVLARPQSGLSKADIVYEALAEGAITRFVAVFLSQGSQVGPVRSAREYYYDWISEYHPAYAHWGGNEYVRKLASNIFGARDLDQFAIGSAAFYRLCFGEHCGYTSTDKLWTVASSRGVNKKSEFPVWRFKDDSPAKQPNAVEITIGFQDDAGYVVTWKYDVHTNSYKRFNGGKEAIDKETGQQLSFKTVVVQSIKSLGYKQATPGVQNRNFETIGSGKALVFLDGTVVETTWKKSSREDRTRFFDSSGKEISPNRGQIWMEMIPTQSSVSFK